MVKELRGRGQDCIIAKLWKESEAHMVCVKGHHLNIGCNVGSSKVREKLGISQLVHGTCKSQ